MSVLLRFSTFLLSQRLRERSLIFYNSFLFRSSPSFFSFFWSAQTRDLFSPFRLRLEFSVARAEFLAYCQLPHFKNGREPFWTITLPLDPFLSNTDVGLCAVAPRYPASSCLESLPHSPPCLYVLALSAGHCFLCFVRLSLSLSFLVPSKDFFIVGSLARSPFDGFTFPWGTLVCFVTFRGSSGPRVVVLPDETDLPALALQVFLCFFFSFLFVSNAHGPGVPSADDPLCCPPVLSPDRCCFGSPY